MWALFCLTLLVCLLCNGTNGLQIDEKTETTENKYLKPGLCKGLWRQDHVLGRCVAQIKPHSDFDELKDVAVVLNAKDCRSICCNLGEKCVTWQYQASTQICKLGPPVRLGLEAAPTGDWCDPNPPAVWNGRRKALNSTPGHCAWIEDLPNQCFGQGPEIKSSSGGRLSTKQCEEYCCNNSNCILWQELPDRGCYNGNEKRVWCDKKQGAFEGGRKCVPKFCGGLEDQILPAYAKYLNSLA